MRGSRGEGGLGWVGEATAGSGGDGRSQVGRGEGRSRVGRGEGGLGWVGEVVAGSGWLGAARVRVGLGGAGRRGGR